MRRLVARAAVALSAVLVCVAGILCAVVPIPTLLALSWGHPVSVAEEVARISLPVAAGFFVVLWLPAVVLRVRRRDWSTVSWAADGAAFGFVVAAWLAAATLMTLHHPLDRNALAVCLFAGFAAGMPGGAAAGVFKAVFLRRALRLSSTGQ